MRRAVKSTRSICSRLGTNEGYSTIFGKLTGCRRRLDAAAITGRFMDVPRVQIYTVDDYFEGRVPKLPTAA